MAVWSNDERHRAVKVDLIVEYHRPCAVVGRSRPGVGHPENGVVSRGSDEESVVPRIISEAGRADDEHRRIKPMRITGGNPGQVARGHLLADCSLGYRQDETGNGSG